MLQAVEEIKVRGGGSAVPRQLCTLWFYGGQRPEAEFLLGLIYYPGSCDSRPC